MHSVQATSQQQRPVVLVGPWEHHSNLLPWRESCAEVVTIRDIAWSQPAQTSTTTEHSADSNSSSSSSSSDSASSSSCSMQGGQSGIDMQHLEDMLKLYSNRGGLLIGAFSAASNLTGVLCDMNAITGKCLCYTMLNTRKNLLVKCNVLASSCQGLVRQL
jgi:selenocysteine lyase/cysteine desulfurase